MELFVDVITLVGFGNIIFSKGFFGFSMDSTVDGVISLGSKLKNLFITNSLFGYVCTYYQSNKEK